jgi:hypothetical protein
MVAGGALAAGKPLVVAAVNSVVGQIKLPERSAPYVYADEASRELTRT